MDKKIEAHFFLGYTCNSHCKHCVIQVKRKRIECTNEEKDLSQKQVLEHIRYLIDKEVYEIVLTGGEPTVRSDIITLCEEILGSKSKLQIQTNAMRTDIIETIVNSKMGIENKANLSFMIPLHSSLAQQHDYVTGTVGGFKRTIASLELLKEKGIRVIGKIVLTKLTGDLEDIVKLFIRFNITEIIIAYPHCVSFDDSQVKKIAPKLEDVRECLRCIEMIEKKCKIILQGIPYCYVNNMEKNVQEDDFEYLGKEVIEYKYKDEYEYKWHEFRKKDKLKFLKCRTCDINDKCEGIWKEYIRVYGNE